MTTIVKNGDVVTLINVFTVDPANQRPLVDAWIRTTDETFRHMPGFVSANIHRSLDGTRVASYAQWRGREDYEAMLLDPRAILALQELAALGEPDAHLYEVAEVVEMFGWG